MKEAAYYLRCSHATIYKQIKAGELHTFKVGSRRYMLGRVIACMNGAE